MKEASEALIPIATRKFSFVIPMTQILNNTWVLGFICTSIRVGDKILLFWLWVFLNHWYDFLDFNTSEEFAIDPPFRRFSYFIRDGSVRLTSGTWGRTKVFRFRGGIFKKLQFEAIKNRFCLIICPYRTYDWTLNPHHLEVISFFLMLFSKTLFRDGSFDRYCRIFKKVLAYLLQWRIFSSRKSHRTFMILCHSMG